MKTILCFGDSNTFGWNPETMTRFPKSQRWPMRMQKLLGPDYHVVEEGLGGRTTVFDDPVDAGRCGRDYLLPCIQSHQPLDLVILMLGTNDTKRTYSPSVFSITRGMEELIKILKNPYNWDSMRPPQILVVSPILIADNVEESWLYELFGSESVELSKRLAPAYEELAGRYDCGFLNAALHATPSPLDMIHIDAEGCKRLASAMAEKAREMLQTTKMEERA